MFKNIEALKTGGQKGLTNESNAGGKSNHSLVYNCTNMMETQQLCPLCNPSKAISPKIGKFCPAHTEAELKLAVAVFNEIARPRKIVQLQKCAGCLKCKSSAKFSVFHAVCKECIRELATKGKTARSNFISRTLANFQRNLQGGLQNV